MSYSYALTIRPPGQREFTVVESGMAENLKAAVKGVEAAVSAHVPAGDHEAAHAQLGHMRDTHDDPAFQKVTLVPGVGRPEIEADITRLTAKDALT